MGGCCCCSSKGADLNNAPVYYYCPRAPEEQVPLSAHHGVASALSTGLLVDSTQDASVPDTYRPPPTPLPYDAALSQLQYTPTTQESCGNKSGTAAQTTNSDTVVETFDNSTEISVKCEDLKSFDCKVKSNPEVDSTKETEVELSKSIKAVVSSLEEEEDVCPTCLEEYDAENPKITTKCEHHFHLACILEWMERSDTCPVCDKEMIFNPPN